MKKLTQKVIEAGLVPRHTLELMKYWQLVPHDATEADMEDADMDKMFGIVEELAQLLEEDQEIPEIKETRLDIGNSFEARKGRAVLYADTTPSRSRLDLEISRDRLGNFIIPNVDRAIELYARPGTRIVWLESEYDVTEVLPNYEDTSLTYYVCHVQEVPEHARIST